MLRQSLTSPTDPIHAKVVSAFEQPSAPLLSVKGLILALLLSVVLSWPMLLVTAPMGYPDTMSYLRLGESSVNLALSAVLPEPPATAATGTDAPAEDSSVRFLRSFVYAAFLYVSWLAPGGLVLATFLQTFATLLLVFAFVTVRPSAAAALAGTAVLAGLTTLPWFASFAMPDILAAAILLYYALLVSGISHVTTGWRVVLSLIAIFAVVSHYGHIPLALGLILVTLAAGALRRTLTIPVTLMAILPVILAAGLNLTSSAVALDAPSLAPKRLPILLARSLDDGPAAWHLRDACPEAGYAICDIFPDGVPDDLSTFLWSEDGIARATNAELDAIREEEGLIIWNAFKAYPVEQLSSFFANVGQQVVSIGTEHINPLVANDTPRRFASTRAMRDDYPALAIFDVVTFWGTFAATGIAMLAWAAGLLPRGAGWPLGVCLIGLFGNALIFGGLSVPVDRYQSRVAWVFPAMALVYWLNQRGTLLQLGKTSA